jgi:hypothetical protein
MKDIRQVAKRRPGDGGTWWWSDRGRHSGVRGLTKAWRLLAIVGLLTALAAACGGGGEPQAEGSATPPPTVDNGDLAPCQALQALEAYRYTVELRLESPKPSETPGEPRPTPTSTITRDFGGDFLFEYTIETSFVAPDRFEASMTAKGEDSVAIITIGTQVWTLSPSGWILTEVPFTIPYQPPVICEAVLADLDLSAAEPQEEKVNNVDTLHYTFPEVRSEQAWAKIYGPGSDLDILLKELEVDLWLSEQDNWPVRMELSSSGLYGDGRELRVGLMLDIRDANSADIRVEPPL